MRLSVTETRTAVRPLLILTLAELHPMKGVNHPELLADKTIAINPDISSGMPMVVSRGISAEIIVQRILAGETADDLADDYRLTTFEIQKAIEYIEKAAA